MLQKSFVIQIAILIPILNLISSNKLQISFWLFFKNVYRQKKFQDELCVEATVQLSNVHHKDDIPAPGAKLVRQEVLVLVNKQPIMVMVIPSQGWTVRKNRTQQVNYSCHTAYLNLLEMSPYRKVAF